MKVSHAVSQWEDAIKNPRRGQEPGAAKAMRVAAGSGWNMLEMKK